MPRSLRSSVAVICAFLLQVLYPAVAPAQTYSYRTYDEYTGLPGSYLNVIAQDNDGLLWVGVDTGLYRYDGFMFHHMPFPDTLPRGNVSALFCDPKGTMWVGMSDGSLFTWKSGGSMVRREPDETDRINRITEGDDGKIWIVTQTRGIYLAEPGDGERLTKLEMPAELTVFDIAFAGDGKFLAATQDNLHLCSAEGGASVSE